MPTSCSSGQRLRFAEQEAEGLNGFEHAVVVEIGEARIPAPAAAREAERLAFVGVRGDAALHVFGPAGADPHEMALFQGVFGRDVADVDVEHAVAIEVGEIDAHALERIVAEHFALGHRHGALAIEDREARLAGLAAIVEQPVGAEIVAEIQLGQAGRRRGRRRRWRASIASRPARHRLRRAPPRRREIRRSDFRRRCRLSTARAGSGRR